MDLAPPLANRRRQEQWPLVSKHAARACTAKRAPSKEQPPQRDNPFVMARFLLGGGGDGDGDRTDERPTTSRPNERASAEQRNAHQRRFHRRLGRARAHSQILTPKGLLLAANKPNAASRCQPDHHQPGPMIWLALNLAPQSRCCHLLPHRWPSSSSAPLSQSRPRVERTMKRLPSSLVSRPLDRLLNCRSGSSCRGWHNCRSRMLDSRESPADSRRVDLEPKPKQAEQRRRQQQQLRSALSSKAEAEAEAEAKAGAHRHKSHSFTFARLLSNFTGRTFARGAQRAEKRSNCRRQQELAGQLPRPPL